MIEHDLLGVINLEYWKSIINGFNLNIFKKYKSSNRINIPGETIQVNNKKIFYASGHINSGISYFSNRLNRG